LVELVPFSFVQQRQAAGPEFPPPLLFCGKEIGFGKLLGEVYPKGDMRNFQFPEIFYQSFAGRRTGKNRLVLTRHPRPIMFSEAAPRSTTIGFFNPGV